LRCTPPCPHFGICGGCSWQHISYSQQLEAKRQILADALWRGARVPAECISAARPSPQQYGYRSRVQFKLHAAQNRLQIGFYRGTSHQVEDLPNGCAIAQPEINAVLQQLRSALEAFPERGLIPQINVECGENGTLAIIQYIGSRRDEFVEFLMRMRSGLSSLNGLWLRTGPKSALTFIWGIQQLEYCLPSSSSAGEIRLGFKPGSFSQVNREQNRAMLETVRRLARFQTSDQVLDLYCGNGNLSLPVAAEVAAVTGIEENAASIAAAQANSSANKISTAEFIRADAVAGARRLADSGRVFDSVILDPPRSGAADAVPEMIRLNPGRIIYVSCDPSTLARDCGLLEAGGYIVRESVPVDMFPQTYHIESITLLENRMR
jgi:23S rRNA (uracil1939-C5)-methyltransferase